MVKRRQSHTGVVQYPLTACYFPMSMIALMMMQGLSSTTKVHKNNGKKRGRGRSVQPGCSQSSVPSEPSQSSVPSVVDPSQSSVQLDLKVEKDPVEQAFREACQRKLQFFVAFASLPRTGVSPTKKKTD